MIGLDASDAALQIARQKADAAKLSIPFHLGLAQMAPFEPGSFDRVLSSLFFHHLAMKQKRQVLANISTLLRPGAELHIADWGKPQNALMRLAFLPVQCLDGFESTRDHVQGCLLPLMEEAGFRDVMETRRQMTVFGTLSFYRGKA